MKILCDTNILIWALCEPQKLSTLAKQVIEHASLIYISSISLWEIAIKSSLGRLTVKMADILDFLEEMDIKQLAINWEHACCVHSLPPHHRDPFDRMLIAQTITENLSFITSDNLLKKYSSLVKVV